jgi:hypothetical protein
VRRPTNGLVGLRGIKILHLRTYHFHLLLVCEAAWLSRDRCVQRRTSQSASC